MTHTSKYGGLLEYPPKMYEEIERWIQNVQKATRRGEIENKIDSLRQFEKEDTEEVRELIDSLKEKPSRFAMKELLSWQQDMEAGEDVPEFSFSLEEGNVKKVVSWFEDQLERRQHDLKKKIKELQDRVDAIGGSREVRPGAQAREFETDLEGWKYQNKGEAAKKALPKIKVHYDPHPHSLDRPGSWSDETNTLYVNNFPFNDWRKTLRHELRHVSQTLLSKATGHERREKGKGGVEKSKPAPGMPSRRVMNPEVHQKYKQYRSLGPQAQEVARRLQQVGIKDVSLHALDDVEFYTRLADSVEDFRQRQKDARWNGEQTRQALSVFTGTLDPKNADQAVRRHVRRADETFELWKKHNPEKWKKGAKELVKASRPKADDSGLQALWKKFLEENYDGGKAKVQNPNPKTRDSHPEITVNYLMGQSDPPYQGARQKIRSQFARWRQTGNQ